MTETEIRLRSTGLLLVDLQNDFLHPEGAYGRAGQSVARAIAALPARLKPLADALRAARRLGGLDPLHPGPRASGGEPFIAAHHLKPPAALPRPKATSAPGGWGHAAGG